jgi:hypothetical protein
MSVTERMLLFWQVCFSSSDGSSTCGSEIWKYESISTALLSGREVASCPFSFPPKAVESSLIHSGGNFRSSCYRHVIQDKDFLFDVMRTSNFLLRSETWLRNGRCSRSYNFTLGRCRMWEDDVFIVSTFPFSTTCNLTFRLPHYPAS